MVRNSKTIHIDRKDYISDLCSALMLYFGTLLKFVFKLIRTHISSLIFKAGPFACTSSRLMKFNNTEDMIKYYFFLEEEGSTSDS